MKLLASSTILAVILLAALHAGRAADSQEQNSRDEKRAKLWQSLRADWQFGKMEIQAYCENDKLDEVLLVCRGDGLLYRLQTHKFSVIPRSRELGPINEITFECKEHRRWRMWVNGVVDYTLPCEP